MADAYNYSSVAGEMALTGAISPSAASLSLNSVLGLPVVPFKVALDPGQLTEEIVKVTAVSGLNLTVVRGWDGTAAVDHAAFAKVRHMATAEDFRLSRHHEDGKTVHGITGLVVGDTDVQVLTGKTFQSPVIGTPAMQVKRISAQTADLQQWLDETGTVLAKVDATGNVTTPNVTALQTSVNLTNAAMPLTSGVAKFVNGVVANAGSTDAQFRLRGASRTVLLRNDDTSFYVLTTDAATPDGTWNALRPITVTLATGNVALSGTLTSPTLVVSDARITAVETYQAKAQYALAQRATMNVPTNSEVQLGWDSLVSNAAMNTAGQVTAATAGMFWVSGVLTFPADSGSLRQMRLSVNGVQIPGGLIRLPPNLNWSIGLSCAVLVRLAVGDTVTLRAFHDAGNTLGVSGTLSVAFSAP